MTGRTEQQNISIQPVRRLLSIKEKFELPQEGLSDADLMRKSASDRTKHRVAHVAWFPLPVIKKPIIIPNPKKIKEDRKNKPIHVYKQCLKAPRAKTDKKRKPKKSDSSTPPVKKAKKDIVSV